MRETNRYIFTAPQPHWDSDWPENAIMPPIVVLMPSTRPKLKSKLPTTYARIDPVPSPTPLTAPILPATPSPPSKVDPKADG